MAAVRPTLVHIGRWQIIIRKAHLAHITRLQTGVNVPWMQYSQAAIGICCRLIQSATSQHTAVEEEEKRKEKRKTN